MAHGFGRWIAALVIACVLATTVVGAQTSRFTKVLINAGSALSTAGVISTYGQSQEHTVYCEWGAGTTAGVITIESAATAAYAGTWAPLATFTWSAASKVDLYRGSGAFGSIRARISTAVTGGTVTCTVYTN